MTESHSPSPDPMVLTLTARFSLTRVSRYLGNESLCCDHFLNYFLLIILTTSEICWHFLHAEPVSDDALEELNLFVR